MTRPLWKLVVCMAAGLLLVACGGIPLRSLPRLMQLPDQLLDARPAEFRVALQVDARFDPPAQVVPYLIIQLTPKVAGAFEPVNKKLPMQRAPAAVASEGLAPASPGRHWLVYRFPVETQLELSRVQTTVRRAQAQPGYQKGGSLSLGIEQTELALDTPALAHTPWQTWLRVREADGYLEVWSGTPAQLLAAASRKP